MNLETAPQERVRTTDMAPEVLTYAQNIHAQILEGCRGLGAASIKDLATADPKKFVGEEKVIAKLHRLAELLKTAMTSKEELVSTLERERVHGIYHTTDYIRFASDEQLRERGYGPNDFAWDGPEAPPEFDPKDDQVVVALVETFGDTEEDIRIGIGYYWRTMLQHFPDAKIFDDFRLAMTVHGAIRPTAGVRRTPGHTRRWVKIKLDAELWGPRIENPVGKMDPNLLPGIEVLAAFSQHPDLLSEQSVHRNNLLWMPGLRVDYDVSGGGPEKWRVPYINLNAGGIVLSGYYPDRSRVPTMMPLFVK